METEIDRDRDKDREVVVVVAGNLSVFPLGTIGLVSGAWDPPRMKRAGCLLSRLRSRGQGILTSSGERELSQEGVLNSPQLERL